MNLDLFPWLNAPKAPGWISPSAAIRSLLPYIQQEFNSLFAQFQGWGGSDHNPDGTHKNVRAENVYAAEQIASPLVWTDAAHMMNGVSMNLATATAQTIVSLTEPGFYRVYAYLKNSVAANFGSMATVIFTGSSGRIVADNGVLLAITLAGRDVQITQTSGVNADVTWGYFRVW